MLIKFFKGDYHTSRGGASPAHNGMNYLLNKSRSVEPRLLSGNPDVTHALLEECPYAKQFTYGCLSFEENDIPEVDKHKHMAEFEAVLMSGYSQEQYDMVWVEHRDKGRLELNFHVVNQDLVTGERLTPFYHKRDIPRIDSWKNITNATFDYSDPNDPAKARTLQHGDVPKHVLKNKEHLDNYLTGLVNDGEINSRKQLVDHINAMPGIEVSRQTKKSISIKVNEQAKPIRMKGAIYEQNFRGGTALRNEQERSVREYRENSKGRINKDRERLDQLCKNIAEKRLRATKRTLENRDSRVERLQNSNRSDSPQKNYYQQNSHNDYYSSEPNRWNNVGNIINPTPSPTDKSLKVVPVQQDRDKEQSHLLQNPVNNPLNPYNNNNKTDNQHHEITTKNRPELDTDNYGRIIEGINRAFREEQRTTISITDRFKQAIERTKDRLREISGILRGYADSVQSKSNDFNAATRSIGAKFDRFESSIGQREAGARSLTGHYQELSDTIEAIPKEVILAMNKKLDSKFDIEAGSSGTEIGF